MSRYCRRSIVIVPMLVFALTLTAQPALAHILKSGWIGTFRSADFCVKQTTEIAHSSAAPGGHFTGGTWAETFVRFPGWTISCAMDLHAEHLLHIRGYWWINGGWAECFQYPTSPRWNEGFWKRGWAKGAFVKTPKWPTKAPCENGHWYTAASIGYSANGATWEGGRWITLWDHSSEWYHWLPEG